MLTLYHSLIGKTKLLSAINRLAPSLADKIIRKGLLRRTGMVRAAQGRIVSQLGSRSYVTCDKPNGTVIL